MTREPREPDPGRNPARSEARDTWRGAVDEVAPTVVILGGFLTAPPFYWPFRRRLLARGAAAVVVAGAWTPHWLLAGVRGLGPIVGHGAHSVAVAQEIAATNPRSRGAPLLVIGHSAGGIVARLLTAEEAFAGRRHALAPAFGALVTLGTPHHVAPAGFAGRRLGAMASRFADRTVPGAAFAPAVGYVTVASRAVVGRPTGNGRERVAHRLYQGLLHDPAGSEIEGDGIVPVASALLDGARHVVLDGVGHGQASGRPWYGADPAMDGWWPIALEAWRAALRERVDASGQ